MKHLSILLLAIVLSAVATAGCAKKQTVKQEEPTKTEIRAEQAPIVKPDEPAAPAMAQRVVYFEFDSYVIREDAKPVLREVSKLMRDNPKAALNLEGHADERGTIEYNLALGERRAVAVKEYLIGLGVSAARLSTYTYGEERPAAAGHDEESWAKNRRVEIVPVLK
ncbi:MAG: peptidoglycan-associated lipoprotein Pal [Candidatus Edwardsbacteria bacterium]|nr:peptidoglycan-associated lipoprotein Pal [Candidatus Edwardsbacteria bacterium]